MIRIKFPVTEIAKKLGVSESQINECFSQLKLEIVVDGGIPNGKPVVTEVESNDNTIHKCERIPRGKNVPCGKRAKNVVEENGKKRWYCGSQKGGCYKSVLGKKPSQQPPVVNPTEIKKIALLDKIVNKKEVELKKISVDGDVLHFCPENRVLFTKEDKKAYGVLSEMNKIQPLTDKDIRWLETCGLEFTKNDIQEEDIKIIESEEETEEEAEELDEEKSENDD